MLLGDVDGGRPGAVHAGVPACGSGAPVGPGGAAAEVVDPPQRARRTGALTVRRAGPLLGERRPVLRVRPASPLGGDGPPAGRRRLAGPRHEKTLAPGRTHARLASGDPGLKELSRGGPGWRTPARAA